MALDVTVLRVFTDAEGNHGNPLGVVDAAVAPPTERQAIATELGYSETIFIASPAAGATSASAWIFTPTTELGFAGHPTVGAAWWLRNQGTPVETLRVPAGDVAVSYDDEFTFIRARADWAPDFGIYEFDSVDDVLAADPDAYGDDVEHYVWAWIDRGAGTIRSRLFAAHLGIREDEATGAGAVRIAAHLERDLDITQGLGSQLIARWDPQGWVTVAGRVVDDGVRRLG
jgi:predicted PhzF superfamily epimerase YddE/YHI9